MAKKRSKSLAISDSLYERAQSEAKNHDMSFSRFLCECLEICLDAVEEEELRTKVLKFIKATQ